MIGEKQNDKPKGEQRWIAINGTNLTHGKIWQHGRSTDCNAQDMSFHWDMRKTLNMDGIHSDRCRSKAIHDVSIYESTQ